MRVLNLEDMLAVSGGCGKSKPVKQRSCGSKHKGSGKHSNKCKHSSKDSSKDSSACGTPTTPTPPAPSQP